VGCRCSKREPCNTIKLGSDCLCAANSPFVYALITVLLSSSRMRLLFDAVPQSSREHGTPQDRLNWKSTAATGQRTASIWIDKRHIATNSQSVSQSVCLSVQPHLGLLNRYFFFFESYCRVYMGHPLWREDGSVVSLSQSVVIGKLSVYTWHLQVKLIK
jgi:hypothetical protein